MKAFTTTPANVALIAHGIQRLVTFNKPPRGVAVGDRIGVHAAASHGPRTVYGSWMVDGDALVHQPTVDMADNNRKLLPFFLVSHGPCVEHEFQVAADNNSRLPLATRALVATATVAAICPIIAADGTYRTEGDYLIDTAPLYDGKLGSLRRIENRDDGGCMVTDYAEDSVFVDYAVGRTAVILSAAIPTAFRCPQCDGTGNTQRRRFAIGPAYNTDEGAYPCPTCHGVGGCPPIMMPGLPVPWTVEF